MNKLPECPRYVAHPQSVWFNEHWRPIIEKLKAENAELKEKYENIYHRINTYRHQARLDLDEITKLTRQRDALKKALEFYADINNWSKSGACSRICGDSDFIQTIPNQTTQPIGGKTARKALQEAE